MQGSKGQHGQGPTGQHGISYKLCIGYGSNAYLQCLLLILENLGAQKGQGPKSGKRKVPQGQEPKGPKDSNKQANTKGPKAQVPNNRRKTKGSKRSKRAALEPKGPQGPN